MQIAAADGVFLSPIYRYINVYIYVNYVLGPDLGFQPARRYRHLVMSKWRTASNSDDVYLFIRYCLFGMELWEAFLLLLLLLFVCDLFYFVFSVLFWVRDERIWAAQVAGPSSVSSEIEWNVHDLLSVVECVNNVPRNFGRWIRMTNGDEDIIFNHISISKYSCEICFFRLYDVFAWFCFFFFFFFCLLLVYTRFWK